MSFLLLIGIISLSFIFIVLLFVYLYIFSKCCLEQNYSLSVVDRPDLQVILSGL